MKDKREKEIATFIFDGFSEIMLNNMQALFEGERSYLKLIFSKKCTTINDEGASNKPDYL